jgi:C-terminal processing protease CtpA/Prc
MQLEVNKDNAYEIVYVSKNSAAQKAGLNVGDVLLSINGKKPACIGGIDEIYSVFKDKDGTRIDLKILRDSKEFEFPLVLDDPFKSK